MKTSDIKLKWQRHNQKNGMSWNEMSEFANEIADHVLSEKIKGFDQWLRSIGSRAWRDDMDKLIDEYLLNNSQVKCECIECGGLFMSDVHQDYCKGCER